MYEHKPVAHEREPNIPDKTTHAARLPVFPLSDALQMCALIAREGRGPFTPDAAAAASGTSATSSTFKQRVASARAFGLIQGRGEVMLTPRALQALDGGSGASAARVDAVMGSGFGGLIEQMEDQPALERPVASVLIGTGLVSRKAARPLAKSLISSAQSAGIVSGGRFRLHDARGRMRLLDPPAPAGVIPTVNAPREDVRPAGPSTALGVIELRPGPELAGVLERIATALERLAPPPEETGAA